MLEGIDLTISWRIIELKFVLNRGVLGGEIYFVQKRDKLSSGNHQRQRRHSRHNLRMFWTAFLFSGRQQRKTMMRMMVVTQAYSLPPWQLALQLRRGAWAS